MIKFLRGLFTVTTRYHVQTINDHWIPLYEEFCAPPQTWNTQLCTHSKSLAYEYLDMFLENPPFSGRARVYVTVSYKFMSYQYKAESNILKTVNS